MCEFLTGEHKVVGVSQPKPVLGFSPNVQDMFNRKDLKLIRLEGISGHGNTFKVFES